jgi:glycosyltransferase involved in cell wall biosynthesis
MGVAVMSPETPDVRIVAAIPAYNCARTVDGAVRGVRAHGLEAVVVDDGSTDDTARLAEEAGAVVLRHATNLGKGEALVTAFKFALDHPLSGVLTLDADGQHDPADAPALVAEHRAHPDALVLGTRAMEAVPPLRRFGNETANFWINLFLGRRRAEERVADTQTGYRLYPAALLRAARVTTQRFETETELLLWASKLGLDIRGVPIRTIYGDERSNFRNTTDALRMIRLVLRSPLWRVPPRP